MAYTTINKSTDYFETTTYTGGATDVSSLSFQPDFVWAKKRDGAENHGLFDAVRGATKTLSSNATSAESTRSGSLTSFDNDGWSMGGSDGIISASGSTYVGWAWRAGGGQGSSNTDGSINTTYTSANTTAGFSIVKWTGTGATATVGHGLGVKPSMIIIKNTGAVENWVVYHGSLGAEKNIKLNNTEAQQDTTGAFNDTEPTSSVFTVHTNTNVNQSGQVMIAYCFAEKTGYSKFGSYTGNGNADGTFVYTGFKPSFVLVKRYSGTEQWQMTDSARDKDVSPNFARLNPDTSSAESTNTTWAKIEKFSNGFKLGGTDTVSNGSGSTYIYMAFGQSLVGSNNVPCTAR